MDEGLLSIIEVVDKDDEVLEEDLPAYEEGEMVPTYTAEKP